MSKETIQFKSESICSTSYFIETTAKDIDHIKCSFSSRWEDAEKSKILSDTLLKRRSRK